MINIISYFFLFGNIVHRISLPFGLGLVGEYKNQSTSGLMALLEQRRQSAQLLRTAKQNLAPNVMRPCDKGYSMSALL